MIEKIEYLESLFSKEPTQSIIDGLTCIHLCMDISITGQEDLIKALENGR
jgi:hypothetical protein